MKKRTLALLTGALSLQAIANTVYIDEEFLKKQLLTNSPTVQNIEANFLSLKLQEKSVLDKFEYTLQGSANYMKTSEKSLSSFAPVTSPTHNVSIGVNKATEYGMAVGVNTFSEQYTNSYVNKGTTVGLGVNFQMDLFKDFLGSLTQAQIDALKYGKKTGEVESDIQRKAFYQSLRKVYWSLVANQEQLNISQGLLKTAERQLKNAEKRYRDNVSDKGEVARYRAQLAARKSNIIFLNYQRETLVQNLKELLPDIAANDIQLKPYNLDEKVDQILACTVTISQAKGTPFRFTKYDDVLINLKNQYAAQQKVTNKYDGMDIKLNTEYKRLGKDFSYSGGYDNLTEDGANSYAVGLSINIPIDGRKGTTQDVQRLVEEKRFMAKQEEITARLEAFHTQVLKNIAFLQNIVKEQQANSKNLEISLKETERKYNQARISVNDLVNDQSILLQSNLDEITAKYNVIATLLDYFAVYTETPCEMNKF